MFTSNTPTPSDQPQPHRPDADDQSKQTNIETQPQEEPVTVGWRMPYDLPLHPYAETDTPWCNAIAHDERDWMGRRWAGRG